MDLCPEKTKRTHRTHFWKSVILWINTIRPKTLIASISPVVLGAFLAKPTDGFHLIIAAGTLFAAITLQIGTNLANDYFDWRHGADGDERLGPKRALQMGLVREKTMKMACITVFTVTGIACVGLTLHGGIVIGMIALASTILGILYTGGRRPLGYLGLGEVLVFPFFGPIAVLSTLYLQKGYLPSGLGWIIGIATGSLSCALLTINNTRDYLEDTQSGKKTLVVRWGRRFGENEYKIFLAIATIAAPLALASKSLLLSAPLLLAPHAFYLSKEIDRCAVSKQYNILLGKTASLFWIYTILLAVALWMN